MEQYLLCFIYHKCVMLSRGTTWPFLFFLQMKISTRTFVHWCMPPHLEMTVKYDQYWCTHVHKHYSQYWLLHWGVSACFLACLLGTNPRWLTNRTFSREYLVVFMHILLLLHKCISEFLEVLYETCETSTRTLCIFVETFWNINFIWGKLCKSSGCIFPGLVFEF